VPRTVREIICSHNFTALNTAFIDCLTPGEFKCIVRGRDDGLNHAL